jgi:hypothetical protein
VQHFGNDRAYQGDQVGRRSKSPCRADAHGAGWHIADELIAPDNITLLPLPPRVPELNPVKNVWQFLRDNRLGDRIVTSYEDIFDRCCDTWNRITEQPCLILFLGLRESIRPCRSMPAGINSLSYCDSLIPNGLFN